MKNRKSRTNLSVVEMFKGFNVEGMANDAKQRTNRKLSLLALPLSAMIITYNHPLD